MTDRRVIAHFMHEEEGSAAEDLLREAQLTESFAIGLVDDAAISRLEERGLIVQVIDDDAPEPLDQLVSSVRNAAAPRAGFDRAAAPDAPTDRYLAQLVGPLLEEWRDGIEAAGARILEAAGAYRLLLLVPDAAFDAVARLPYVLRLRPYNPAATEAQLAPARAAAGAETAGGFVAFDIGLHRPEDADAVLAWLVARHVPVAGHTPRKVRALFAADDPRLRELETLPEVSILQEHVPPVLYNDRARVLLGLDDPTGAARMPQTGAGQVIGIADSGLDDGHPDFQGRIAGLVALGRPNDASDTHGHGTHVAGSALGDGSGSNGATRGTAPEAQVFFQSVMDGLGRLSGLPLDLADLFQEAYDGGARIHNDRWGADVAAAYTFNSAEADAFVHAHPDMTIVVAAGNAGTSSANENVAQGFVDWLSIGAPATSKNALTVGASRSDRTSGGIAARTHREVWPRDFPDGPIGDEPTSGDPERMAGFSSRGPCDDRRIKPDLVAPGTSIASAKSSRAPLRNFDGPIPDHGGRYAYMSGTSMAAPLVAGCAALVRQHYADAHGHAASAALVKATLINGTRWLSGPDAQAEFGTAPNFHQGFGCVNMPATLPSPAEPDLTLVFLDDWESGASDFTRTGDRRRFRLIVEAGLPLRLCLAWTDVPARALQNNLNLFVQKEPRGDKHMGNADLPLRLRLPDAENNVEIVRIPEPEAGSYLIQISAQNLVARGQSFALVATGRGLGPLHPA